MTLPLVYSALTASKKVCNLLGLVLSSLIRTIVVVITTIVKMIATSSKTPHLGTNMSSVTVLPALLVVTY